MKTSYYEPTKILVEDPVREKAYKNQNGIFKTTSTGHRIKTLFDFGQSNELPKGQARDLYDVVDIGDCVHYDAGTWSEEDIEELKKLGIYSKKLNEDDYVFGGFSAGREKVSAGWRVFRKTINRTVVLISSNVCEKFSFECDVEVAKEVFSKRKWDMYVDNNFATKAYPLSLAQLNMALGNESIIEFNSRYEDLVINATDYWLCDTYKEPSEMCLIDKQGYLQSTYFSYLGIRVMVELKANVLTSGKSPIRGWRLVLKD